MRFFSSRAASKYSMRTAKSRTRFMSSRRRPNVIRAITKSTPGIASETITLRLSQLSKGHHHFVFHSSLRLGVFELPLETRFGIFELRHIGNHGLHIDAHDLARRLAKLEHHTDRRFLTRGLVERGSGDIVLCVEFH